MKSRITIEVDFENGNQPVLQILNYSSLDVRDKLLSVFIEGLGASPRWLKIEYAGQLDAGINEKANKWLIRPIKHEQLTEEASLMYAWLNINPDEGMLYRGAIDLLDSYGVPRGDEYNNKYSFAGRIHELIKMAQNGSFDSLKPVPTVGY